MFPGIWKKSNLIPVYRKGEKHSLENYHPVSLFPICGKVSWESHNWSGFWVLCSKWITHSGFCANNSHENRRAIFLDTSKTFEGYDMKACYINLKLRRISGSLLTFQNVLSNRFPRVVSHTGRCPARFNTFLDIY